MKRRNGAFVPPADSGGQRQNGGVRQQPPLRRQQRRRSRRQPKVRQVAAGEDEAKRMAGAEGPGVGFEVEGDVHGFAARCAHSRSQRKPAESSADPPPQRLRTWKSFLFLKMLSNELLFTVNRPVFPPVEGPLHPPVRAHRQVAADLQRTIRSDNLQKAQNRHKLFKLIN